MKRFISLVESLVVFITIVNGCSSEIHTNTDIYIDTHLQDSIAEDTITDYSDIISVDDNGEDISTPRDITYDSYYSDIFQSEDSNDTDFLVETGVVEDSLLDTQEVEDLSEVEELSDTGLSDTDISDISNSPCPPDMANIDDKYCIDLFEGALQEFVNGEWIDRSPYLTVGNTTVRAIPARDRYPQAYISGKEAEIACNNSGKRLCNLEEWLHACQGPYGWIYPYGNQYETDFCNDTYITGHHPLCDYFKLNPCDPSLLNYQQFNDPGINQMPDTISKGGEFSNCISFYGVYDMHGNVHEWISDPKGTFKGGFYADAKINGKGCLYTTTAHEFTYHDYSTGFRCCKDIIR